MTIHEDAFEGRLYDALRTANLSRLRLLEIESWGNGDTLCSVILHVLETCKTLTTLRLPAWQVQTVTRLIRVLSRTSRGLKVLRLDSSHRQYVADIVPSHVLVTLNCAWDNGGMRGLRRLEFGLRTWHGDPPLSEIPSVISLSKNSVMNVGLHLDCASSSKNPVLITAARRITEKFHSLELNG